MTSPSRFVLISDAATEGARGGFFVIDRKTDAIWAEECAFAQAKIAVLEAQAMERGFEAVFEKAAFGDAVEIWTDNTCVKALLIRRFSFVDELNNVAIRICGITSRKGLSWKVGFVPSKSNGACQVAKPKQSVSQQSWCEGMDHLTTATPPSTKQKIDLSTCRFPK